MEAWPEFWILWAYKQVSEHNAGNFESAFFFMA
jgi:hypothetical protein